MFDSLINRIRLAVAQFILPALQISYLVPVTQEDIDEVFYEIVDANFGEDLHE